MARQLLGTLTFEVAGQISVQWKLMIQRVTPVGSINVDFPGNSKAFA